MELASICRLALSGGWMRSLRVPSLRRPCRPRRSCPAAVWSVAWWIAQRTRAAGATHGRGVERQRAALIRSVF